MSQVTDLSSKDMAEPPVSQGDEGAATSKAHSRVFKRITSKIRNLSQSSITVPVPAAAVSPSLSSPSSPSLSPPSSPASPPAPSSGRKPRRKLSMQLLSLTSSRSPEDPQLSFVERKDAALRANGLVPAAPRIDRDVYGNKLHRHETVTKDGHDDYVIVPVENRSDSYGKGSDASRIKEEWTRRNMQHENDGGVKPERRKPNDIGSFPRPHITESSER